MTNEELSQIMREVLAQMREANGLLTEQRKINDELYTQINELVDLQKKTVGVLQDIIMKELHENRGSSGGEGPEVVQQRQV